MEAVHELVSEHAATFTFGGSGLSGCGLGKRSPSQSCRRPLPSCT